MCIRDRLGGNAVATSDVRYGTDGIVRFASLRMTSPLLRIVSGQGSYAPVSYTHLRAHETVLDLVCRLLLEKKKQQYTSCMSQMHK